MMRAMRWLAVPLLACGVWPMRAAADVRLVGAGNVAPEVKASTDLGPADPATPLKQLALELRPEAAAKSALAAAIRALDDPKSPAFHHWMTTAQMAAALAIPDASIATAEGWLKAQGFTVTGLSPLHSAVFFSGTVGQVNAAFRTSLHQLRGTDGRMHLANVTAPLMPASLAAVSSGLQSLHDFRPHHLGAAQEGAEVVNPYDGGHQDVGAGDLQMIYSINQVHAAGYSGQGQTIAVLELADLYSTGDWLAYRRVFGLTKAFPQGQLMTVNPAGAYPCGDPGADNTSEEVTLDAEVVTAAAPNSTIIVASCASTVGTDGIVSALGNLLSAANRPQVVSISYGSPEASFSEALRSEMDLVYMQAAGLGVSIFVSGGDDGPDANHADYETSAVNGISVNGRATSEWNVAVGGTDFADTYQGTTAQYWSATNSAADESALSYVPEFTWNGTCGSVLLAQYTGFSQTYGAAGFCNSSLAPTRFGLAGGGGASACRTGQPTVSGVIGGTCAGEPKPSWQENVPGNPNDGVRDIPDVAMYASGGVWKHGYAICYSNSAASANNAGCAAHFVTSGGTSAAAPLMAGIQLLIDQGTHSLWGNPDSIYYALARTQFQAGTIAACDASLGKSIGAGCVFHDVTAGDTDVPCVAGSLNCYAPSGAVGVLSLSTTSYQPAFAAGAGWDFTSGNGSVNAANLLSSWATGVALAGATPIQ